MWKIVKYFHKPPTKLNLIKNSLEIAHPCWKSSSKVNIMIQHMLTQKYFDFKQFKASIHKRAYFLFSMCITNQKISHWKKIFFLENNRTPRDCNKLHRLFFNSLQFLYLFTIFFEKKRFSIDVTKMGKRKINDCKENVKIWFYFTVNNWKCAHNLFLLTFFTLYLTFQ